MEMQHIFFGFLLSFWLGVPKGMRLIKVVSWKLGSLGSEMFSVANILYDLGVAVESFPDPSLAALAKNMI